MSFLAKAVRTACYIHYLTDSNLYYKDTLVAFKRDILGLNERSSITSNFFNHFYKVPVFVLVEEQHTSKRKVVSHLKNFLNSNRKKTLLGYK